MNFTINGCEYTATTSTFPGGEEFVKIPNNLPQTSAVITVDANLRSSKAVLQLIMLTDALRRYADHGTHFTLNLTYLPYARQDRVCAKGESFSLKVFSNLINSLQYDKVMVADCHSEVGLALIDNVVHYSQYQCLHSRVETHNLANAADVIVAPDAGAAKKAQEIADHYDKPLIQCLKTRGENGRIKVQVLGSIRGLNALVVDDICDGGGTFLALAAALEDGAPDELNLYVTHGIFSKGKQILLDAYDKVEAYDDWTI